MEIKNRSVFHEYYIEQKLVAGLVLTGTEVKSLRAGKASFNEGFAARQRAPIDYDLETIDITLYIDKAAIELFADKGRTVMTAIVFPSSPYNKVEIVSPNREVRILSGSLSKLKSIWK